jgi:hypothetical protein
LNPGPVKGSCFQDLRNTVQQRLLGCIALVSALSDTWRTPPNGVNETAARGQWTDAELSHLPATTRRGSSRATQPCDRSWLVELEGCQALLTRHGDHSEQHRIAGQHTIVG